MSVVCFDSSKDRKIISKITAFYNNYNLVVKLATMFDKYIEYYNEFQVVKKQGHFSFRLYDE